MASRLTASARYTSGLPPEKLLAELRAAVEPLEGGFKLMSKLSGGGVVIRVLRAPKTERRWFGTFEQDRFSIAMIPNDKSGSPFQPILRGHISAKDSGSALALELATHPDARAFSILFTLGGALLATASLIALSQSPLTGLTGLAFAALFLAFPGFRARVGFEHACEASLAAFEERIEIERLPQDG